MAALQLPQNVPADRSGCRRPHRHQDAGRSGGALRTRGEIAPGKRADLIRGACRSRIPVVRMRLAVRVGVA